MDDGVEALEGADEVGAVGPGAAEVEVEGVAVFFGGEGGGGGGGDGGAELGGFAAELAVWVGVFVDGGLEGGLSWGFMLRGVGLDVADCFGHVEVDF